MGKKMKTVTRILSVFLSMVLLFEVIPMQVFAADMKSMNDILMQSAESKNTEAETDSAEESKGTENTPAEILSEDTEKREKSVKHFRMSDGTIQAAQYAVPVHFEKDGVWTDYDNTLTEVDADEEENEGRSILKNKDLINQTADYSVRLSKKTNGKKFVRLEKDGYKISWYYQNANKSTAKIEQQEEDDDPTTLEKLTSTVLYEDVFKATDFEYILNSEGVKENLLLQSAKAPTAFTAEYKVNGLTPVAVDEKTVELRAEDGTVIYVISAPYMEDANGEVSNGVTLSIISVKNNTFTLQIDLDAEWLSAEDRAFPVTVDPVIQTQKDNKEMTSTFVDSLHPNTAHGKEQDDLGSMYVGRQIDTFGTARAYIKVNNLPDIGGIASKVVGARLSVCKRNVYTTADYVRVNAYQVTSEWTKDGLKYNQQPKNGGDILDYMVFAADNKIQPDYHDNYLYPEFKTIEITDVVRGWYEGAGNYGIMLDTDVDNLHKIWYFSMEYPKYENIRPVLTVSYRNMSGYEDYWSYTNIVAGRGGNASVNNYNGNFVFAQPITQGDGGNLMPVNLSLVYNANQEKRNSGEQKPYVIHSLVGAFMQTNYHMYVVKESGQLAETGYKYYLNDADGTKHWFLFENGSTTEGKDEDGLGLTLTVGSDSVESNASYIIKNKDETKWYFNSAGHLMRVQNASGVNSTVQYETETDSGVTRIKSITDGAGRVYTFLYGWGGQPEMVTGVEDPAGRITEIVYNGDFTVNSVKFADGKTVQFLHGSNYLLTEIKGIDGTRTKISYDGSEQKRVSQLDWGTSDSNLLEKYNFTYKQNSTQITDIQNRSYTYQFNNFGQTTGVVSDEDGSAQFFELGEGNSPDRRANKLLKESRVLQSVTNYAVNPGFTRAYADGYVDYIENTANQSVSIDASKKNLTDSALKIYKGAENTGRVNAVQRVNGLSAGTYTFSAYVNTDGTTLTGDAWVLAEVWTTSGGYISSNRAENTTKTDGWERKSVTFDVPDGCQVRLIVGFSAEGSGTVWYDDLQLEKGEGVSTYNLVENSGFTNGMTNWGSEGGEAGTHTWAGLAGFDYCGKLPGTVEGRYKSLLQMIPVSGKKGDVFSFGMWAYAASAPTRNDTKNDDSYQPYFEIVLHYYDASGRWKGYIHLDCNADLKNQWQFVTEEAIIPEDYGKISISLLYDHNVNNAYLTGAFCYKEQYGQTYDYDKDGNVVSTVDLAKTNSTFAYYGNQMSKMLNPSGSKYLYTYDEKKQLTYALSSDGQQYGFTYDDKGNVTKAEITGRQPATTVESGKEYILVNAYSGQAMDSGNSGNSGAITTTYRYTPTALFQHWKLEQVAGTSDVYMLKSVAFAEKNYYLDVIGGENGQGTALNIYPKNNATAQQFKIVKKQDNTFSIFTACSNYTKLLDGQFDKGNEIVQSQPVKQATPYLSAETPPEGQRWYFYPVEATEDKTVVTETSYTESKNFVSATTDQRGNKTDYTYDEQKGTLTSTTDALGRTTNYTYDANNNSLLSVSSGGMTNSYAYENDRLKTIHVNNALQYRFNYDVFGRTTSTEVGNGTNWKTLSSLEYNNAGLLSKQTYGNGNFIDFTYDNLDRITERRYNGSSTNRVTYLYGADGSLAQTVDYSVGTRTQFTYDLADRLVSQKEYATTAKNGGTLRSSTDYTYADKTNYLTGIKHFSPLGTQNIGYTYGDISKGEMPDQVYKVSWNGQEKVNYTYDTLGRLTNKSVIVGGGVPDAPRLNTLYTYVDVGETKTTTLVSSVQTAAGTYSYTYDSVGNIKSTSFGTKYTNTYDYDDLNQLVRENNQQIGKTYTYAYQNGNITERKEYAYTTGDLPEQPQCVYSWSYNNSTWSDLLTDFNGIRITYDEIGNPTAIGEAALSWNGRQLQRVVDGGNTYNYAYNIDGQRVSKTVTQTNNTTTTTEFFYNGSILAGQKTGENTLVFMYDNNGNAFGFTYNGTEYYYLKNAQNDVDAIVDTNRQIVAKYAYDAWGKVVSVTDADGVEITDNTHIGHINPLRYRSYYYDQESNFYYLNSRYYAPDICRFLNADAFAQTGHGLLNKNMFAYCLNNPINMIDSNGEFTLELFTSAIFAKICIAIYVAAIAILVLNQPQINQGITTGICNAVDRVNQSISNTKAKVQERVSTRRKAKDGDPRIHHIVAKAAWRARPARAILEDVGIDPKNAPENLITISHGLHKSMHTKKYYEYVNSKLEPCAGNREAVEAALLELRGDIAYAEETGIRRWEVS